MSDDEIILRAPLHMSLGFFDLLAQQYHWASEEVRAGRMTREHQLRNLNRLFEVMLAPTQLPPLPDKF